VPPFFPVSANEKPGVNPAMAEATSKARRDIPWR
jgi:hypothetical protein